MHNLKMCWARLKVVCRFSEYRHLAVYTRERVHLKPSPIYPTFNFHLGDFKFVAFEILSTKQFTHLPLINQLICPKISLRASLEPRNALACNGMHSFPRLKEKRTCRADLPRKC